MGDLIGIGQERTTVQISAVVFPPCICGASWRVHGVTSRGCEGYQPARPIEDLGTRVYQAPGFLPWWKRMLCNAAWAIEFRLQGWRERQSWSTKKAA